MAASRQRTPQLGADHRYDAGCDAVLGHDEFSMHVSASVLTEEIHRTEGRRSVILLWSYCAHHVGALRATDAIASTSPTKLEVRRSRSRQRRVAGGMNEGDRGHQSPCQAGVMVTGRLSSPRRVLLTVRLARDLDHRDAPRQRRQHHPAFAACDELADAHVRPPKQLRQEAIAASTAPCRRSSRRPRRHPCRSKQQTTDTGRAAGCGSRSTPPGLPCSPD
jgi:hypothetical protein